MNTPTKEQLSTWNVDAATPAQIEIEMRLRTGQEHYAFAVFQGNGAKGAQALTVANAAVRQELLQAVV